ncbi:MAG: type I restriction endonuclease subunit R [Bacteroidales bacterium]|nr:type I restriction endonuclease subunit R [Bacteroidales bacterium]
MTNPYNENNTTNALAAQVLNSLGWTVNNASEVAGFCNDTAVIRDRFIAAVRQLNPKLPDEYLPAVYERAARNLSGDNLLAINRQTHEYLTEGIKIETKNAKGEKDTVTVRLIDYKNPLNNDFLAIRELTVQGRIHTRRADMVGFVNGLPLVFMEFKNFDKDVYNAYIDNYRDYTQTIPQLFWFNSLVLLSNGIETKVGSLGSKYDFFSEYLREQDHGARAKAESNLGTTLRLLLDKAKLIDILENFIVFDSRETGLRKILARNHQILGVNAAIEKYRDRKALEGRLGVFWHTQGSGKSYTMVFLARKIQKTFANNPVFVLVTDREELNRQLAGNFMSCGLLGGGQKIENFVAQSQKDLLVKLKSGTTFIFTLIQKFNDRNFQPLALNREVVMFFDEAHRSQYGKFARNIHKLLPVANRYGFTGTPLLGVDEITKKTFGFIREDGKADYTSIYDFSMAVEDKATVPLLYVNDAVKLDMQNEDTVNAEIQDLIDTYDYSTPEEQAKTEKFLVQKTFFIGSETRLRQVAKNLAEHFIENRHLGKAMCVSIMKYAAVRMYLYVKECWADKIAQIETELSENRFINPKAKKEKENLLDWMKETVMEVVVSDSQNEVDELKKLGLDIDKIRAAQKNRNLEKEFKNPQSPFRLAFVCAMWITGFDVPELAILYLDKPLKAHTLMQTIARVNRVCPGKQNGLVVDYIGISEQLKKALEEYGEGGSGGRGGRVINLEELFDATSKLINELETAIDNQAKEYGIDFSLQRLVDISAQQDKTEEMLVLLNNGASAILRTDKFKKSFNVAFNRIEANFKILFTHRYQKLSEIESKYYALSALHRMIAGKIRHADISDLVAAIDSIVSENLDTETSEESFKPIDISKIDFKQLSAKFKKSRNKEIEIAEFKEILEKTIEAMLEINANEERKNFYKQYQKLIEQYNLSHDRSVIEHIFEELLKLTKDITAEQKRAFSEGFEGDEMKLAVYDLLCNKKLKPEQIQLLKQISKELIDKVVAKVKQINMWRSGSDKQAVIKSTISTVLYGLPEDDFSDEEIENYTNNIFRYFYDSKDERVA